MAKIKLTKGELKKQRDSLKQFRHYLPTLQLKKQQLQMKILEARKLFEKRLSALFEVENRIKLWMGLLADPAVNITEWIMPTEVLTDTTNIAGANIPVYKDVRFKEIDYDFYTTPFWVDQGILELRELMKLLIETNVIREQIKTLQRELQVTTQRVNLFEKIKIPECLENIRRIRIYLGDLMANAVGISKVAKGKVESREEAAVA